MDGVGIRIYGNVLYRSSELSDRKEGYPVVDRAGTIDARDV